MKVLARRAGPSLCGRPRFIPCEEMLGAWRRIKRTPTISISGLVDMEFWFTQTACGHCAARVGYLLDELLGLEKLVDISTEGNICAADNLLSDDLEGERSVADPTVEIIRVDGVRAGNDDSNLVVKIFGSTKRKQSLGDIEADEPWRQRTWNRQVQC